MADPTWQDGVTPLNAANMVKLQTRDEKAVVNGYASLGLDGKVPAEQLPTPAVAGSTLTYRGDWAVGTYVDGDVVVASGVAYLCVGGPTVVPPDPNLWDDATAPSTSTPWVPMWVLAPSGGILPGSLVSYAGASSPSGWLLCDGASVARATYAALFAVIGSIYGSVDGTHFNLPDLRGRIPVGVGTHANVDALGDNDGSALADRQPAHRHTVTDPTHSHNTYWGSGGGPGGSTAAPYGRDGVAGATDGRATGITVQAAGTSAPLETPAFIALNYIIKT